MVDCASVENLYRLSVIVSFCKSSLVLLLCSASSSATATSSVMLTRTARLPAASSPRCIRYAAASSVSSSSAVFAARRLHGQQQQRISAGGAASARAAQRSSNNTTVLYSARRHASTHLQNQPAHQQQDSPSKLQHGSQGSSDSYGGAFAGPAMHTLGVAIRECSPLSSSALSVDLRLTLSLLFKPMPPLTWYPSDTWNCIRLRPSTLTHTACCTSRHIQDIRLCIRRHRRHRNSSLSVHPCLCRIHRPAWSVADAS